MDRIELASVPGNMPLPLALTKFKANTRALVVHRPVGEPFLLTASDIAAGINDALDANRDPGSVTVAEIEPSVAVRRVAAPPSLAGVFANSRMITSPERDAFESVFHAAPQDADHRLYTIQYVDNQKAIVVTASERYGAELGETTTICRCVGNPVHTFEKRQLVEPDKCNKPHGVAVVCSQAD